MATTITAQDYTEAFSSIAKSMVERLHAGLAAKGVQVELETMLELLNQPLPAPSPAFSSSSSIASVGSNPPSPKTTCAYVGPQAGPCTAKAVSGKLTCSKHHDSYAKQLAKKAATGGAGGRSSGYDAGSASSGSSGDSAADAGCSGSSASGSRPHAAAACSDGEGDSSAGSQDRVAGVGG